MIAVSAALLLVAVVLLVIGLLGPAALVYVSIAAGALALVVLLMAVQQRVRDAPAATFVGAPRNAVAFRSPAAEVPAAAPAAVPAAVRPSLQRALGRLPVGARSLSPAPAAEDPPMPAGTRLVELDDDVLEDTDEPRGGLVLIAPGDARYHVDGCPSLSGQAADVVDVLDAREEGLAPCGVCRPDATLAGYDGDPALEGDPAPDDGDPAPDDSDEAPRARLEPVVTAQRPPGPTDVSVPLTGVVATARVPVSGSRTPVVGQVARAGAAVARAVATAAVSTAANLAETARRTDSPKASRVDATAGGPGVPLATTADATAAGTPVDTSAAPAAQVSRAPARPSGLVRIDRAPEPGVERMPPVDVAGAAELEPEREAETPGGAETDNELAPQDLDTALPAQPALPGLPGELRPATRRRRPSGAAARPPVPIRGQRVAASAQGRPRPAARRLGVVVVPTLRTYHRANCPSVDGVDGRRDLTRTAAAADGFRACEICRP